MAHSWKFGSSTSERCPTNHHQQWSRVSELKQKIKEFTQLEGCTPFHAQNLKICFQECSMQRKKSDHNVQRTIMCINMNLADVRHLLVL